MEDLIQSFDQISVTHPVSSSFINEINYICDFTINHYSHYKKLCTDVLDILGHCGHDLAYDMSDNFEADCHWFLLYGKAYIFNYITTRIELTSLEEFNNINDLITNYRYIYNIIQDD